VPLEKGENLLLWWSKHEGQFSNCSIWLRNEENIKKCLMIGTSLVMGGSTHLKSVSFFFFTSSLPPQKIYYPMLFFEFLGVTL
jgi:hypothetical protein